MLSYIREDLSFGGLSAWRKSTPTHIVKVFMNSVLTIRGERSQLFGFWKTPTTAEPIIEGDILCWFAGVSDPSIIRPSPNEGYFTIVAVFAGALSALHPADGSGNEGQTSQQISNLDLNRMYHHQERPIALIWNWGHDEAFWEMKGEFAGRWPSDWRHLGKSEVEAANDRYSAMAAVFDELCDRDGVLRAVRGCSEDYRLPDLPPY